MSSMFFDDVEAVKIAATMEQNGLSFYTRAAEQAQDPAVRKMFKQLAEDEKNHMTFFENLERQLLAEPRSPTTFDNDELNAYMQRLVESHVFATDSSVTRILAEADNDIAALAVGIRAERDTMLFYQEMLDFTDSKAAHDAFAKIIDEERRHLVALADRSEQCENLHG
jgi:rubrerythrin